MRTHYLKSAPQPCLYANSLDAFIPEQWAMESVAILVENMVAANLVHRDFEKEFAKYGDIVNTRQPGEFTGQRKTNTDNVTTQDATATNIAVPLDQHMHVSFLIHDGDETRSMKDLVEEYIKPAAIALARMVDKVVLGQYPAFLANQAGTVGGLTNANAVDYITGVRAVMNRNKAHTEGRNLILGVNAETKVLQNPTFHQAEHVGDEGTALREASLGRKLGFDTYMAQNMASIIPYASGNGLGEVNNAAGYPKGTTVIAVDGMGASEVVPGNYVAINGNVYHVTATDNATATQLTLEWGLIAAVADNDDITVYPDTTVNFGAGYAAGYAKYITLASVALIQEGAIVSFTTSNVKYVVLSVVGSTVLLDRPLEAAIADTNLVSIGPSGDYNLAFHKNAMTLVLRPLKLPRPNTGAASASAEYKGVPMRVVITYDGEAQAHRCTLDFLAGIKVLDTDLGAVMLS